MLKTELIGILENGESSGVEFKRDDAKPESVAKELCALLNLQGGTVLLGIEDDGTVSGLRRSPKEVETWVMNLCRDNLQPPIIPFWETIVWEGERVIGLISVPRDAADKPYRARQGGHFITFVRVGSTSRQASIEEERRLHQSSGGIRFEIRPVPGSTFADLDVRRLNHYFAAVRGQDCPPFDDVIGWERLLVNTELMVEDAGRAIPTVGGVILFARDPRRFLPQAGVSAVAYRGVEKDYAAIERSPPFRAPLAPLFGTAGLIENGLIEEAMDFVRRNTGSSSQLVGARRVDRPDYPNEAVRETIVNALVHRDYTIAGTDVELSIYPDRIEVISPGSLPNTITVERMKAGCRYARNELLRDFHYVEHSGLGVPRKIIKLMQEHNGTVPDLIEEEHRFTVRLWKEPKAVPASPLVL